MTIKALRDLHNQIENVKANGHPQWKEFHLRNLENRRVNLENRLRTDEQDSRKYEGYLNNVAEVANEDKISAEEWKKDQSNLMKTFYEGSKFATKNAPNIMLGAGNVPAKALSAGLTAYERFGNLMNSNSGKGFDNRVKAGLIAAAGDTLANFVPADKIAKSFGKFAKSFDKYGSETVKAAVKEKVPAVIGKMQKELGSTTVDYAAQNASYKAQQSVMTASGNNSDIDNNSGKNTISKGIGRHYK